MYFGGVLGPFLYLFLAVLCVGLLDCCDDVSVGCLMGRCPSLVITCVWLRSGM
jgi:hypothetical protein